MSDHPVRALSLALLGACSPSLAVRPTENALRFVVEAEVPPDAVARVTVWPEDEPGEAFVAGEQAGPEARIAVFGLRFDRAHRVRVDTLDADGATLSSAEVPLRTPRAPFDLPVADVAASADAVVDGVLLNFALTTPADLDLMLIVDRDGQIVWYEDATSHDPAPDASFWDGYGWDAVRNEVLALVGHRRVLAMGLDGTVTTDHATGELVSHDVRRVGDRLLLPATRPFDGPDGRWLEDGWLEIAPDGTERLHWLRDLGLSPEADPPLRGRPRAGRYWGSWVGDPDAVDWTHVNALDVQQVDGVERVLLSLKNLDQVVRADRSAGALDWRMGDNGAGGEHSAGDFTWEGPGGWFGGQHGAQLAEDGTLWLFDNGNPEARGAEWPARALRLAWDEESARVWTVEDHDLDLVCPYRGSALPLPDHQVLATCGPLAVLRALTPEDRTTWEASFTCPDDWPSCSVYRGIPLSIHPR